MCSSSTVPSGVTPHNPLACTVGNGIHKLGLRVAATIQGLGIERLAFEVDERLRPRYDPWRESEAITSLVFVL